MLPEERRQQIREWIKTRRNLKTSELCERFGVSEMTIHRDIKLLVEEGLVMKTYGGITLVREEPGKGVNPGECVYCHRPLDERLVYRLILSGNRTEEACCGHCGLLRHAQQRDQVVQALCYDFFTHTTINATLAWFVLDTAVNIRCCQPQVLTFENREFAEGFVKGFGGSVFRLEEAMERLQQKIRINS